MSENMSNKTTRNIAILCVWICLVISIVFIGVPKFEGSQEIHSYSSWTETSFTLNKSEFQNEILQAVYVEFPRDSNMKELPRDYFAAITRSTPVGPWSFAIQNSKGEPLDAVVELSAEQQNLLNGPMFNETSLGLDIRFEEDEEKIQGFIALRNADKERDQGKRFWVGIVSTSELELSEATIVPIQKLFAFSIPYITPESINNIDGEPLSEEPIPEKPETTDGSSNSSESQKGIIGNPNEFPIFLKTISAQPVTSPDTIFYLSHSGAVTALDKNKIRLSSGSLDKVITKSSVSYLYVRNALPGILLVEVLSGAFQDYSGKSSAYTSASAIIEKKGLIPTLTASRSHAFAGRPLDLKIEFNRPVSWNKIAPESIFEVSNASYLPGSYRVISPQVASAVFIPVSDPIGKSPSVLISVASSIAQDPITQEKSSSAKFSQLVITSWPVGNMQVLPVEPENGAVPVEIFFTDSQTDELIEIEDIPREAIVVQSGEVGLIRKRTGGVTAYIQPSNLSTEIHLSIAADAVKTFGTYKPMLDALEQSITGDLQAPEVIISTQSNTIGLYETLEVTARFSESVQGVTSDDLGVLGGRVLAIDRSESTNQIFRFLVKAEEVGTMQIRYYQDAVSDTHRNPNSASEVLRVLVEPRPSAPLLPYTFKIGDEDYSISPSIRNEEDGATIKFTTGDTEANCENGVEVSESGVAISEGQSQLKFFACNAEGARSAVTSVDARLDTVSPSLSGAQFISNTQTNEGLVLELSTTSFDSEDIDSYILSYSSDCGEGSIRVCCDSWDLYCTIEGPSNPPEYISAVDQAGNQSPCYKLGAPGSGPCLRPWQNSSNQYDVNNDGVVNQLDLDDLQPLIPLYDESVGPQPQKSNGSLLYPDVTGDCLITIADLLALVSYLRDNPPGPSGPAVVEKVNGIDCSPGRTISLYRGGPLEIEGQNLKPIALLEVNGSGAVLTLDDPNTDTHRKATVPNSASLGEGELRVQNTLPGISTCSVRVRAQLEIVEVTPSSPGAGEMFLVTIAPKVEAVWRLAPTNGSSGSTAIVPLSQISNTEQNTRSYRFIIEDSGTYELRAESSVAGSDTTELNIGVGGPRIHNIRNLQSPGVVIIEGENLAGGANIRPNVTLKPRFLSAVTLNVQSYTDSEVRAQVPSCVNTYWGDETSIALEVSGKSAVGSETLSHQAPHINSINPSVAEPGNQLTVSGTNLCNLSSLEFTVNGQNFDWTHPTNQEQSVLDASSSQSIQTNADGVIGSGQVIATNSGGQSNPVDFTLFAETPVISQSNEPVCAGHDLSLQLTSTAFDGQRMYVDFLQGSTLTTHFRQVSNNQLLVPVPVNLERSAVEPISIKLRSEFGLESNPHSLNLSGVAIEQINPSTVSSGVNTLSIELKEALPSGTSITSLSACGSIATSTSMAGRFVTARVSIPSVENDQNCLVILNTTCGSESSQIMQAGDGPSTPVCGNGVIEGDEECDGAENCDDNCTFTCGNGVLDDGEECDGQAHCDNSCRLKCGNGVLDVGEPCDKALTDGCNDDCTSLCGDGIKSTDEQCDGEPGCADNCTWDCDSSLGGAEKVATCGSTGIGP